VRESNHANFAQKKFGTVGDLAESESGIRSLVARDWCSRRRADTLNVTCVIVGEGVLSLRLRWRRLAYGVKSLVSDSDKGRTGGTPLPSVPVRKTVGPWSGAHGRMADGSGCGHCLEGRIRWSAVGISGRSDEL
jgi:hypothetical protein